MIISVMSSDCLAVEQELMEKELERRTQIKGEISLSRSSTCVLFGYFYAVGRCWLLIISPVLLLKGSTCSSQTHEYCSP